MTKMHNRHMSSLLKFISQGDIRVLKLKPARFLDIPSHQVKFKRTRNVSSHTNKGLKLVQNLRSMQAQSNGKMNKHLLQKLITCAMACQESAFASISNLHYASSVPALHSIGTRASDECFRLARQILAKQNVSRDTIVSCAITCTQCASECRKYTGPVFQECIAACDACATICYNELYKIIQL